MSLQDIFYTLGIIVAVLNIVFLIALSIGAWYAYKFYTAARSKIMNNLAPRIVAMQLIRKLVQAFRSRRRARAV